MHRAGRVDRGEPLRDLAPDVAAELLGHVAHLLEQVTKRLPLDVLHDEDSAGLSRPRRSVSQSKHRTTFGCRTCCPIRASRRNRSKNPGRLEEVRVDHLEGDDRSPGSSPATARITSAR